jgi:hypothetical protein
MVYQRGADGYSNPPVRRQLRHASDQETNM